MCCQQQQQRSRKKRTIFNKNSPFYIKFKAFFAISVIKAKTEFRLISV